jgi:hypothetical protein
LPKLASGQGGAEEETKGVALASQQEFYLFLLELEQDRIRIATNMLFRKPRLLKALLFLKLTYQSLIFQALNIK